MHLPLRKVCARCVDYIRRPVAWGAVMLSYVGIFMAILFGGLTWQHESSARDRALAKRDVALTAEANAREQDFCHVIVSSYDAAKADYKRMVLSVRGSRAYLHDPDADVALARLIKVQLPRTIAARHTAKLRMISLKPPETCKPYQKE